MKWFPMFTGRKEDCSEKPCDKEWGHARHYRPMEKHKERTHNNGGVKTECNVKKKKKIYNTSMKKCFLDSNLLFMCLFEKKKKNLWRPSF